MICGKLGFVDTQGTAEVNKYLLVGRVLSVQAELGQLLWTTVDY